MCFFSCFQFHPSHLIQGLIQIIFPFLLHVTSPKIHVQLISKLETY